MKSIVFFFMIFAPVLLFAEDGMHHESQLGVVLVGGNATSESYNLKQTTSYEFSPNLFKLTADYLLTKSSASGVYTETARSWDVGLRYERALSEMFTAFADHIIESDIFAGYIQRNNTDLGAKYYFFKNKDLTWFAEGGFRYIYETRPDDTKTKSALRAYTEASYVFNESVTGRLWIEYIPTLTSSPSVDPAYTASTDWYLNSEPSLTVLMSKVFSLKTAYLLKYHNYEPSFNRVRLDTQFTTALVAKF